MMNAEQDAILTMAYPDSHRVCLADVLRRTKEPPNYGKITFQDPESENNVILFYAIEKTLFLNSR